jgi:hypothetical protein
VACVTFIVGQKTLTDLNFSTGWNP